MQRYISLLLWICFRDMFRRHLKKGKAQKPRRHALDGYSAHCATHSILVWVPLMLENVYTSSWINKGLASMLSIKSSAGVILDVNLRNPLHTGKKAHMHGFHSGFETQGRHHQKSRTGVGMVSQKGLMSSNFFIKREKAECWKNRLLQNTSTQTWFMLNNTHVLWTKRNGFRGTIFTSDQN